MLLTSINGYYKYAINTISTLVILNIPTTFSINSVMLFLDVPSTGVSPWWDAVSRESHGRHRHNMAMFGSRSKESGINVMMSGQETKQLEKSLDILSAHQNAPGLMRMISPLGYPGESVVLKLGASCNMWQP